MDKFDLKKYIAEGKLLKKEISENEEYKPFVKGETFLKRTEFIDLKREYLHFLDSKEEYDYLIENGVIGYLNKYLPEGVDVLVDSPEKMHNEEYSLGNDEFDDGLPIVREDQSTNQLKEDVSKHPEYEEGASYDLIRTEGWVNVEVAPISIDTKEEYDFLVKNGLQAYLDEYEEEFEAYAELEKQYKEYDSIELVKTDQGRRNVIMDKDDLY